MGDQILLVDGSEPMRRLVCRFLAAAGVSHPVEAGSTDEALEKFAPGEFKLVVTDCPGWRGLDFLRAIRRADPDVLLVVMSTDANPQRIEQAEQAGATDYLLKPFGAVARQKLLDYCRPAESDGAPSD